MDKQKTHSQFIKDHHNLDIVVLCDDLTSPANIGGVLRLADAYGVNEVVFVSEDKEKLSPKIKSVSRGTQNYVKNSFSKDYQSIEEELDRVWICLEITKNSTPLKSLGTLPSKVGIIIGNENKGINATLLERFPAYHLKMYGNNSSMNVTNSLSAMLFYITQVIE
jgi:tRNA G18 (ribose-2'-O)-methylase SpoU